MVDVCQKIQPGNTTINNTNTNTNSHNKTFNLNFFLNEQCKDAMNINDFIKSIKIEVSDLERLGKEGYVEGFSRIILEKLKDFYRKGVHVCILTARSSSAMIRTFFMEYFSYQV
jgi:hypothetical protein